MERDILEKRAIGSFCKHMPLRRRFIRDILRSHTAIEFSVSPADAFFGILVIEATDRSKQPARATAMNAQGHLVFRPLACLRLHHQLANRLLPPRLSRPGWRSAAASTPRPPGRAQQPRSCSRRNRSQAPAVRRAEHPPSLKPSATARPHPTPARHRLNPAAPNPPPPHSPAAANTLRTPRSP